MDNSIKNIDGSAAREIAAQFFMQEFGQLKQLDSMITSGSKSLLGLQINPQEFINKIPVDINTQQPLTPLVNTSAAPTIGDNTAAILESKPFDPTAPLDLSKIGPIDMPGAALITATVNTTPIPYIVTKSTIKVPQKCEADQFEFNFTYDMAQDILQRQKDIEKSIKSIQATVEEMRKFLTESVKPSALKKSGFLSKT